MFSKKELRDRCVTDGDIDPDDKSMQDLEEPIHCNPLQLIKLNILAGKRKRFCCLKAGYEDILLQKAKKMYGEHCDAIELLQLARESKEINRLNMEPQLYHNIQKLIRDGIKDP